MHEIGAHRYFTLSKTRDPRVSYPAWQEKLHKLGILELVDSKHINR